MKPAELFTEVYEELRRLAAAKLTFENPGQTLSATALVHEAFLRLGGERSFAAKKDFLAAAAVAMRRILVDRARARNADKRGGEVQRVDLESNYLAITPIPGDIEALDEALSQFSREHPQQAKLVELRFFGGLTLEQCAEVL